MKYRPEVDGLRAIAVMSVLFYHAGFTLFGGGYVGVDVFFVISGYLITNIIVREIGESGSFQFRRFYLRRLRRLFPALMSTILFTWFGAFLLFSPAQMQDFGASAIGALASVSNVYFWFEADYFDAASVTKPLLHTWSLSVEEQFYFIWPALIVFVLAKTSRTLTLILLALIGMASLLLAEYWLAADRDAAFYLLPSRVFELGFGAALVWLPSLKNQRAPIVETGAFAGLGLIIWSILAFDHDTLFPGTAALVPCLGAALFLACSHARIVSAPLRAEPMVWLGKISYSLYLVHWPIIVFYAVIVQDQPNAVGRWLIVLLSIILGWMQYRLVENRFRHGAPGRDARFAMAAAACGIAVAVPSFAAWNSEGMTWRVPSDRLVAQTNDEIRREVNARYCSSPAPKGTFAAAYADIVTCQNYRGSKHDIYIWGDSHALHLVPGMSEIYDRYNVHVAYMNGCVPQSGFAGYLRDYGSAKTQECARRNRAFLDALKDAPPAHVIVTSAKRGKAETMARATREIVAALGTTDHSVKVLADFIRPGKSLIDCVNVPDWLITDMDIENRCTGSRSAASREMAFNQALAKLVPNVIPINDLQCPGGVCKFFHRGRLLYRDSHHLNVEGSVLFTRLARSRLKISTRGWGPRFRRYVKAGKPYLLGNSKALRQAGRLDSISTGSTGG